MSVFLGILAVLSVVVVGAISFNVAGFRDWLKGAFGNSTQSK